MIHLNFLKYTFLGNTIESYLWVLGILLIGLILKRFISKVLSQILFALFKRFSKTVGVESFLQLMNRPIQLFIMVIIVYFAFNQLSFPAEWHIGPSHRFGVRLIIFRIFEGILIFSIIWIIVRAIDFGGMILIARARRSESRMDDQLVPFAKEAIKVLVAGIGFFILVGVVFNLDVVSLVTGLGIGGLAFALAAKETLENLIGSFLIFLDKPFVVGDIVKVGNVEGRVDSIGFRSTRIRGLDRIIVIVPNKKMTDAELMNDSERVSRRANFSIKLSNDTSPEQMKTILSAIRKMFSEFDQIEVDPIVRFTQFDSNSFDILIIYFAMIPLREDFYAIQEHVNFELLRILNENKAVFAMPSSTVYTKTEGAVNNEVK